MNFKAALIYGKLINAAIKVIDSSRGSNKAGEMALAKCPDMIKHFKGIDPSKVIFITGTNGKSTTTNLINHIFTKSGYKVVCNLEGANLLPGICTALIKASDLSGNIKADYFVFETDERYLHKIRENLECGNLLVTNIMKDQVQRNGDPDFIYRKIEKVTTDFKMDLFLNADEPRSRSLEGNGAKVIKYGAAQHSKSFAKDEAFPTMPCPKCRHKIRFKYYNNDMVGGFECVNCGFGNDEPAEYISDNVDLEAKTFTVNGVSFNMPYDPPFMLYNYSSAVAVAKELGGISEKKAAEAFADFKNIAGRIESIEYKGKSIKYMRSKQEAPETLQNFIDVIAADPAEKAVVIGFGTVDDITPYYINSFYGYDCDFSALADAGVRKFLCVTDTICYDSANCLIYGGVDPGLIEIIPTDDSAEIAKAIASLDCENVYLNIKLDAFEDLKNTVEKEA